MTPRQLLLLAVLAVAASGAIASGGFTTTDADRNATVTVVDDSDAYLGIQTDDVERNATHEPDAIHLDADVDPVESDVEADLWLVYRDIPIALLTNRITHAYDTVDAELQPESEPPAVETRSTPDGIETGESGPVTVDVKCPVVVLDTELDPNDGLSLVVLGTHDTNVTTGVVAESTDAGARLEVERNSTVRCHFPGVEIDGDDLDDSELDALLDDE